MNNQSDKKSRYESTLKHADTEEWIDLRFYRPMGYAMACGAEKLGVTPNAISVFSIFLGVGAGVLFYFPSLWINVIGILLLIMADICDSADGQLARMTGQFSRLGRILDGACGDLWFISIYVAICLRLSADWGAWIWVLASATGACHSIQAAMADYYRNFHLFFAKGKSGSELDDSSAVVAEYEQIRFCEAPVYKVFMFFYKNYTREQEFFTPMMQRFRKALRMRYANDKVDATLAEQVRLKSLPYVKYTNILSFNCRAILLSLSLLIGHPWVYFVGEITVFNILLVYMCCSYESICKTFLQQLESK